MNLNINEKPYSVSVVIPAYNGEKYIGRAIDSVLAQSHPPDEIIVVDDGSSDGTGDVVGRYASSVRYIYQENAGASVARNAGIEAARSEWIAFLDADDCWLKDKLKLQIEHLKRNADLVWSCGNFMVRSSDHNSERPYYNVGGFEHLLKEGGFFDNYFQAYLTGFSALTSTTIVKRSVFDEVGMFLVGQMWAQDTDMFFRIAYRWPMIGFIAEPVTIYHLGTPGSITEGNRFLVKQRCDLVARHLELSAKADRIEEFRPCALKMLKQWVRGIFRNDRFADVSEMLKRFDILLPGPMKIELRLRMSFPRTAPFCFNTYFRLKRFLCGPKKK